MTKKSEIMKDSGTKVVLADGKEYTIKLDLNALCLMQDKFGANALEELGNLDVNNFKAIRSMLHVFLSNENLTENEVGALIDMSNINTVVEALGTAVTNGTPQADETVQVSEAGK